MQKKIIFEPINKNQIIEFVSKNQKRKILNFLNGHDLYQSKKKESFKKILTNKNNFNFLDGTLPSVFLSIKNYRKIPRIRGPTFTRILLESEYSKNKKHLFIGLEENSKKKLQEKFPHLKKIYCYNPPYITGSFFDEKEINKIIRLIKKEKPYFVWIGTGCPKQNFLSEELFKKTSAKYFLNVGAALDFIIDKKKEAPPFFRKMGIEWLYRMITDFRHSYKKVFRSFAAILNLNEIDIRRLS